MNGLVKQKVIGGRVGDPAEAEKEREKMKWREGSRVTLVKFQSKR